MDLSVGTTYSPESSYEDPVIEKINDLKASVSFSGDGSEPCTKAELRDAVDKIADIISFIHR